MTNAIDWNWFFGAISQCVAAIVGFFGAFIITKIINRDAEYEELLNQYHIIQGDIESLKLSLRHFNFSHYNFIKNEMYFKSNEFRGLKESIKEKIKEEDFSFQSFNEYLPDLPISYFVSRNDLIDRFKKEIYHEKGKELHTHLTSDQVKSYEIEIDKLLFQTDNLISNIRSLFWKFFGFPFGRKMIWFVLIIITLLFYIGIIYPVSFLPVKGEVNIAGLQDSISIFFKNIITVKGIILSLVSLLFTITIIVFYRKNNRHKFERRYLDYLEKYHLYYQFSEHLRNYEANTRLNRWVRYRKKSHE